MDIRKPKAIRSWRELLTEVGTIVLGVSIALAAEQGVEYIHWRNQVAQARTAIAGEMAGNILGAVRRMRAQNCIERRLDVLAKILDEASVSGRLPPVGYIAGPPVRSYSRGTWDSVVASQAVTHFPRGQLVRLGTLYGIPEAATTTARSEMEAWSTLSTMSGPGRRLDPAAEAELRNSLALARSYNRSLANIGFQLVRALQTLDLPYSREELAAIAAAPDQSLTEKKFDIVAQNPFLICQPLGPVPPEYGHDMRGDVPDYWEWGKPLLPGQGKP